MKVAVILLNKGRGSGVVAKEHVDYLLSKDHTVYFLHPEVGAGIPGAINKNIELESDTLPVHEYLPSAKEGQKAVSAMSFDEAMAYVPAYEKALAEIIDDVDIVLGHHANLTAIATHRICKAHNKPFVLFLHGTGIEPRHFGHYDDGVWQQIQDAIDDADGLIVTTEYVRENLVRNIVDVAKEEFLIQPCGVNTTVFHPDATTDIREKYDLPETYVICPGALTHVKGPQNVVEASKHYADHAATVFIGDGELRTSLEQQLGDRGVFLGFVSNEDKAKLINAATLLVAAPEKKEHFGIIYIEAMAGGTPVVAYEGGGVNSIVTRNTGVLTERTPDSLGNAVKQILSDPGNIDAMASEARQRAVNVYADQLLGPVLENWLQSKIEAHA